MTDHSARFQPLDPAFNAGQRRFLEGWMRAERLTSLSRPHDD